MILFTKRSFTVLFSFVFLILLSGCKPEYPIETIVRYADPAAVNGPDSEKTTDLLMDRLVAEYGEKTTLTVRPDDLVIVTYHRDLPIGQMGKLLGFIGSARLGINHLYENTDAPVRGILDTVSLVDYDAQLNDGRFGASVLAFIPRKREVSNILRDLNRAASNNPTLIFVSGPSSLKDAKGKRMFDAQIYALRVPAGQVMTLSNKEVASAKVAVDPNYPGVGVEVTLNEEGAEKWEAITAEAAIDNKRQVAIMLNDEVISAPNVNSPISEGQLTIMGQFSVEQAENIARQLTWEPLPLELKVVAQQVVE